MGLGDIYNLGGFKVNHSNSIGIFDSGLGGISVLNRCINIMPAENFIYFADKKNAPYGDKTKDEIISLMIDVMDKVFIPNNVKAVVIACNTATNAAIDVLREKYNIDIIGTEPAIKPAIRQCPDGKKTIVLATESTINSKRFKSKLSDLNSNKCIAIGCSGLVELIESNKKEDIKFYLKNKFHNISPLEIDSVVLGCTHYPFIMDCIKSELNKEIAFFDGGEGVARRLKYILEEKDLVCKERKIGAVELKNSLDETYNDFLKKYIRRG